MKKILLLLVLISFSASAQKGAFEVANELYRKGKYSEAAEAYENLLKTRKHSAELYFNLGNAYYKQTKVAPAIYNYEKALLLDPNDDEILNNLDFARKLQIDEVKHVPRVGFNKMIQNVTSSFAYDTWAVIAVVAAFCILLLFAGYYFSGRSLYKRIFFNSMFLFLAIVMLSVTAAVFEKDIYAEERPAIVFADIVAVKAEPTSDSPDAFVLHEGTKLYILEELEQWRKVALTDNTKGWIEASAIREIK